MLQHLTIIAHLKAGLGSLAIGCLLSLATPAVAWDGAVEGVVSTMSVTGGSNYGLRIYLSGIPALCNGGPSWAFLNDTDSNYKTYAAALMLAKAQGNRVMVYSNLEGSYCHIGYIEVR